MSSTTSPRGSSREKLLEAAGALITRQGVHELTLDAVAAAAGVTKSGLIYHFKTKDDLLGALVVRMIEQLDMRCRATVAKRGDTRSARLLTQVDDTFGRSRDEKQLLTNLLAAASTSPFLLEPVQAAFAQVYDQFSDGSANDGLALVLAAALDGIALLELLDIHQFTKRQREAMRKALLELIPQLN